MTEKPNQLLADTMTLRDLYKKSHWQVAGPTFYQLHLLFDKHFNEQVELVDSIAERIQILDGVSIAMAPRRVGTENTRIRITPPPMPHHSTRYHSFPPPPFTPHVPFPPAT